MLHPPENDAARPRRAPAKRWTRASVATVLLLAVAAMLMPREATEAQEPPAVERLPGTAELTADGDLIDRILAGSQAFLDRQLQTTIEQRRERWSKITRSAAPERDAQLAVLRARLQHIIGADDPRPTGSEIQVTAPLGGPASLAEYGGVRVQSVRWPVLEGYIAEGLVVLPDAGPPTATIILCPDASMTAEQLVGLERSSNLAAGLPLQLAAAGCQVIIPQPISRRAQMRGGRTELTDREYVYRCTYVLGRHPLGLEVQTVRALLDSLRTPSSVVGPHAGKASLPIGIGGHGEGGLVALLAAAIDPRIDSVLASGVWGNRDAMWSEPISRSVFGFLSDFGDAELAIMIGPRPLIIETSQGPEHQIAARGAAPGKLHSPTREEVARAAETARQISGDPCAWLQIVHPDPAVFGSQPALSNWLDPLGIQITSFTDREERRGKLARSAPQASDATARSERQINQIEALTQRWIRTSRKVRREMIEQLPTDSTEQYLQSVEPLRERFERDVMGRFDEPLLPPATRSRLWQRNDRWTGWEVELDVYPELVAGGILLVPNDASPEDRRSVVVCVHGLEGLASDTIIGDHNAYKNFAARLCEQGYVVFCPQQLYRAEDRFRVLQRKANPLGKTLFSLMIPQHRQITRWLQGLPVVRSEPIAFYGLSYGGKSAMRIPAVVTEYGPTICSGDFNEWVLKNASTSDPFSYVWTGEYEIFEFNLAGTFSYAEMAALICPRPFMVERGHFDGVAEDRWVAFEYAPVRYLYAARLGIPERTEIEWFAGPHTINGQATFDFLKRHLGGSPAIVADAP